MGKRLLLAAIGLVAIGAAILRFSSSAENQMPAERVARNTSIPDTSALEQMAHLVFKRAQRVETQTTSEGIVQSIETLARSDASIQMLPGQTAQHAAKAERSSVLVPLLFSLKDYLPLARQRGLKRLQVTVITSVLDVKAGKEMREPIYAVNIPENAFDRILGIQFQMNAMSDLDQQFAKAGVETLNGFDQVSYK